MSEFNKLAEQDLIGLATLAKLYEEEDDLEKIIQTARAVVIFQEQRGDDMWSPRRASPDEIAGELGGRYVPVEEDYTWVGLWPAQGGTKAGEIHLPNGTMIRVTEEIWWHGGENTGGWCYDCHYRS